jgi:hypothetical protein
VLNKKNIMDMQNVIVFVLLLRFLPLKKQNKFLQYLNKAIKRH